MNKLSFSSHFAIISLPLHTMKRTLYVFLFMLLLTACGGCRDGDRLLNDAEKIVEEFPDSALHMLERYDTAGIGKAERALHDLLLTEVRYKLYKPIDNDSLISCAVSYFEEMHDLMHLANAYYYKGVVLYDLNSKENAVTCLKRAEELAEGLNDELLRNKIYENLSYINLKSSNNELALHYSRKFISSSKVLNDMELLARAYDKLSVCFYSMGNDSMATIVYDSIKPILSHASDSAKAYILTNMAVIRLQEKRVEEAKSLLLASVGYKPKANEYLMLGKIAFNQGELDSARYYLEKTISFNDNMFTRKAYTVLSSICSEEGDYEASFLYLKKADSVRHIIQLFQKTSELQAIQLKYDATVAKEKKNARIRLLLIVIAILLFTVVIAFSFMYAKIKKLHNDLKKKAKEIETGIAQIRLYKIRVAELKSENQDSISRQIELNRMIQSLNLQIGKMMVTYERKNNELNHFLSKLHIAESDIEEKNAQLTEMKAQLALVCDITNAHLSRGKCIYDSLSEKSTTRKCLTKTDEECLTDYYIVTHYDEYTKIFSTYHALSLRLYTYVVLNRMGLTEDRIQELLGVTNTTLRVYRNRLKKKLRKDKKDKNCLVLKR